jgi:pyruvate formate lyase activating enzyme
VLQNLLDNKQIDYIALDFKAPESKFNTITQSNLFAPFEKSLNLILKSKVAFEVRTTFHSDLLTELDLKQMIQYLENKQYKGNYYVQFFKNNVHTISKLNRSINKIDQEKLSTPTIKIIVRE